MLRFVVTGAKNRPIFVTFAETPSSIRASHKSMDGPHGQSQPVRKAVLIKKTKDTKHLLNHVSSNYRMQSTIISPLSYNTSSCYHGINTSTKHPCQRSSRITGLCDLRSSPRIPTTQGVITIPYFISSLSYAVPKMPGTCAPSNENLIG